MQRPIASSESVVVPELLALAIESLGLPIEIGERLVFVSRGHPLGRRREVLRRFPIAQPRQRDAGALRRGRRPFQLLAFDLALLAVELGILRRFHLHQKVVSLL